MYIDYKTNKYEYFNQNFINRYLCISLKAIIGNMTNTGYIEKNRVG